MMRKKFNLDIQTLDKLTVLLHGNYGHGKTHFLGDALRTEASKGSVAYLNVAGEDGYLSIAGMGLGEIAETVDTIADYEAVIADFRRKPLRVLGVDSVKALARIVMNGVKGGRMLEKSDYIPVHWAMERLITQLRQAAQYVICACPSDKSVDQISGRTYITPDLPGREAVESAGWFDFVGFITADVTGAGTVQRKLTLTPSLNVVTRQRLPIPITANILIPEGGGGWANFLTAVQTSLNKAKEAKKAA